MVQPLARVASIVTAPLQGPVMMKHDPKPHHQALKNAAPPSQTPQAPNKGTYPSIPIDNVSLPTEVVAAEFASEIIGTEVETLDPKKKLKKAEHSHTAPSNQSKQPSDQPQSQSSINPSSTKLRNIYQKISRYDHQWNQAAETTLRRESWEFLTKKLGIEDLTPKTNISNSNQGGYRSLKLSNIELRKLAKFKEIEQAQFAENPNKTNYRVHITPEIAKILKHAIREVDFYGVATAQDLSKHAVRATANLAGKALSAIPLLNVLDGVPRHAVSFIFGANAFIRQFIQSAVRDHSVTSAFKSSGNWAKEKLYDEVDSIKRPIKAVKEAINHVRHSSVTKPGESEV